MKKVLLFLVLLALSNIPVSSQTVYWTETFDNTTGWSLQPNWTIGEGRLEFSWYPSTPNFDFSALSPAIQLHATVQELIVKQHLSIFGSSNPPEVAEIYLITATSQHLLWSHNLNLGSWGVEFGSDIAFDVSTFAGQTVQFKFRTFGQYTWNWNWWQIFDLKLTTMFENDLAAMDITGPNLLKVNSNGIWNVLVKNLGNQTQQSFAVSFYSLRFGNLIGTVNVNETLIPQQTTSIDFNWTPTYVHNTMLYAVVNLPGDNFSGNNTSQNHFVRVKPEYNISILVWDNDNGISSVVCPDQGDLIRPTTSLLRILDKAGITYDVVNALPQSLAGYDIVFVSLGCYCLS